MSLLSEARKDKEISALKLKIEELENLLKASAETRKGLECKIEELGKQIDHSTCHDVVCNCNHSKHPRGAKGVGCSCVSRQNREMKEHIRYRKTLERIDHAINNRRSSSECIGEICEILALSDSNIEFCKDCGEYITKDGDCSNPFCPEEMDDGEEECECKLPVYWTYSQGVQYCSCGKPIKDKVKKVISESDRKFKKDKEITL